MATEDWTAEIEEHEAEELLQRFNNADAQLLRDYLMRFNSDMTSAELIGAFRKLIDTGVSTDAEECALLDLLVPLA